MPTGSRCCCCRPSGKAGALNAAVGEASHPLLVFADARQRFAPDAIRRLVSHFDDPAIGAVSGELMLDAERLDDRRRRRRLLDLREVAAPARSDRRLHAGRDGRHLRDAAVAVAAASRRHDPRRRAGADARGARRIPGDVRRPGARVSTRRRATPPAELRRKSRTLAGNYQLLAREPRLLVPIVNPVWLQFVSHKVGRLIVPYALVARMLASSAWLASVIDLLRAGAAAQLGFYGLAAYGALLDQPHEAHTGEGARGDS